MFKKTWDKGCLFEELFGEGEVMFPIEGCLVMLAGTVMKADVAADILIRLGHLSGIEPF